MIKCLITVAVVIMLFGCVNQPKRLEPQLVDGSFTRHTITWTGTWKGLRSSYDTKLFDSGGKLAVCAVRDRQTGSAEEVQDRWLAQNASVYVGGVAVAPAGFVASEWDYAKERWAHCIETEVPSAGKLYQLMRF